MASRTFVKPLWNVRHDEEPERTTLQAEMRERRYSTGRGYCVTADSPKEARDIVHAYQMRHHLGIPPGDQVSCHVHRGVPVLMEPPRW